MSPFTILAIYFDFGSISYLLLHLLLAESLLLLPAVVFQQVVLVVADLRDAVLTFPGVGFCKFLVLAGRSSGSRAGGLSLTIGAIERRGDGQGAQARPDLLCTRLLLQPRECRWTLGIHGPHRLGFGRSSERTGSVGTVGNQFRSGRLQPWSTSLVCKRAVRRKFSGSSASEPLRCIYVRQLLISHRAGGSHLQRGASQLRARGRRRGEFHAGCFVSGRVPGVCALSRAPAWQREV